jgi:hypothetical protein
MLISSTARQLVCKFPRRQRLSRMMKSTAAPRAPGCCHTKAPVAPNCVSKLYMWSGLEVCKTTLLKQPTRRGREHEGFGGCQHLIQACWASSLSRTLPCYRTQIFLSMHYGWRAVDCDQHTMHRLSTSSRDASVIHWAQQGRPMAKPRSDCATAQSAANRHIATSQEAHK